jgi:hypothetical protein
MIRKRARHSQKEKDRGIIEMAAEQFAILFWKEYLHGNKEYKSINIIPFDKSLSRKKGEAC